MTASSPVAYVKVPRPSWEEYDDDLSDFEDAQSISGTNIDPTKLTMLLRIKFGAGAYDIHIMQNSYCIIAPRKLSTGEIAKCRKR